MTDPSPSATASSAGAESPSPRAQDGAVTSMRTVVSSSIIGTTIEWFDFFAYSTAAALVLNTLFFPSYDPLVGTILAFGGIAVGYFGRPLGSVVFGHYGDRLGRKTMLVVSLLMMGGATFAIGLLPTYSAIGVAAPVLLMVLRFVQGFALGGEWGGAVLIVVEHAEPRRRGLMASAPQVGLALGLLLSTVTFLLLDLLPAAAFESWGWRVPFLLSASLVLVGMLIRLRISETPEFARLQNSGTRSRVPIMETLATRWRTVLLAALAFANVGAIFYALFTFSITYGTTHLGMSRTSMLMVSVLCSALAIAGLPLAGRLSDKYGRAPVFTAGIVLTSLLAYPMFWLIDSAQLTLMTIGYLLATVGFCASYGTLGILYAEAFSARIRYTGMSLALGLGTVVGSAFVPMIYLELLDIFGSSAGISLYIVVTGLISVAAVRGLQRRPQ
ncbi:MFS transporter [Nocardia sp. NPDC003963]